MKKRKIPRFENLTAEEYQAFTQEMEQEIKQMEEEHEARQIELAELELRIAYLDKIKQQNILFSGGKNLL